MLSADELAERRELIAHSDDLTSLLRRLTERATRILGQQPYFPEAKALLSADGGVCPDDGTFLLFDPWSPDRHRCPRCHREFSGERHDRHWARLQHLWLAERAAHLAVLACLGEQQPAAEAARAILTWYGERYLQFPNQDNVLGPSRLFFSTYLESVWLCNYLAAATLLRESDRLDQDTEGLVGRLTDEAVTLIGDYDEGFSNRQTWNNAALAAAAVWFEDEELARRAIESPTGLLAHLVDGFGSDGMWFEGENYHLFAMRGFLTGSAWARAAGADLLSGTALAQHLHAALRAPTLSALPDFTFPARKDSRFGISLSQPMYLESWEIGAARLAGAGWEAPELSDWLAALYRHPAPAAEVFESYLHEVGEPPPAARARWDLSWWSLLEMAPELRGDPTRWSPETTLLETQGLAVLRRGDRYVSLETGRFGGGHGHPDRLHLTLHANGEHWLADYGTGSYVSRDLFWYRSTLAHNAPRLDGVSQSPGDAVCEMFEERGDWAWVRGRFAEVTRSIVAGPRYLLDVVELTGKEEHTLELPWHLAGEVTLATEGTWVPGELSGDLVREVERFLPRGPDPLRVTATASRGGKLTALWAPAELLRARAPGPPGSPGRTGFHVLRARGRHARLVSVVETGGQPIVQGLRATGEVIEIETAEGTERHRPDQEGWVIELPAGRLVLRGRRAAPLLQIPVLDINRRTPPLGTALWVPEVPPLDGTLEGFDLSQPLELNLEDQYRRSEEPYAGADNFSATAYVNWNEEGFFVAVAVTKPEVTLRGSGDPPLRLDNEPDDIHSDGLQVYLQPSAGDEVIGFLVVPSREDSSLRVRGAGGTAGEPEMLRGGWAATDGGYGVTFAVHPRGWAPPRAGDALKFDLLVNEMRPGRVRRSGQLVWSGGNGWVWLRGDRQEPERFGRLELK